MDRVPRFPEFPEQPKGTGGGEKWTPKLSWKSYRLFVTKHNTKLVSLWAISTVLALGYCHYEITQGREIKGITQGIAGVCVGSNAINPTIGM